MIIMLMLTIMIIIFDLVRSVYGQKPGAGRDCGGQGPYVPPYNPQVVMMSVVILKMIIMMIMKLMIMMIMKFRHTTLR